MTEAIQSLNAGPAAFNQNTPAPVDQRALQEFEALILSELLRPLFDSVETPGLAGGGSSERIFGEMLHEQYATTLAESGGVGVADQVRRALVEQQFIPDKDQLAATGRQPRGGPDAG